MTAPSAAAAVPAPEAARADPDPRAPDLAALAARARYELDCLAYPQDSWLPEVTDAAGRKVHDAVIVGAGQGGLATAFALARARVTNVAVLDRAPAGAEGPWTTFARMPTLRTPKYLSGPDCGIPSLTFQAWYEAQRLAPAWPAVERIPTPLWAAYLGWLRGFLHPPVDNGVAVDGFRPTPDGFVAVDARRVGAGGANLTYVCRKLVFANGIDGGGRWTAPAALAGPLPRERYAHTSEPIDFERLRGRRVAVLGIGASALDNAAAALEAGAASVSVSFRKSEVPSAEVRAWIENVGFLSAFGDLDDARRWAVMRRLLGSGAPPPAPSLARCRAHPNFSLHPGTVWTATRFTGAEIAGDTSRGPMTADFIIFGTGAVTRLDLRPEFAAHAGVIARWRDRFPPAAGSREPMADYPYLGRGFELVERTPGAAPWLGNVHVFNWAATASAGIAAASITGMKFGLGRLVGALVRDLYLAVADRHVAEMPWPDVDSFGPE